MQSIFLIYEAADDESKSEELDNKSRKAAEALAANLPKAKEIIKNKFGDKVKDNVIDFILNYTNDLLVDFVVNFEDAADLICTIAEWIAESGSDEKAVKNFYKNKLSKVVNYMYDAFFYSGTSKRKFAKEYTKLKAMSVNEVLKQIDDFNVKKKSDTNAMKLLTLKNNKDYTVFNVTEFQNTNDTFGNKVPWECIQNEEAFNEEINEGEFKLFIVKHNSWKALEPPKDGAKKEDVQKYNDSLFLIKVSTKTKLLENEYDRSDKKEKREDGMPYDRIFNDSWYNLGKKVGKNNITRMQNEIPAAPDEEDKDEKEKENNTQSDEKKQGIFSRLFSKKPKQEITINTTSGKSGAASSIFNLNGNANKKIRIKANPKTKLRNTGKPASTGDETPKTDAPDAEKPDTEDPAKTPGADAPETGATDTGATDAKAPETKAADAPDAGSSDSEAKPEATPAAKPSDSESLADRAARFAKNVSSDGTLTVPDGEREISIDVIEDAQKIAKVNLKKIILPNTIEMDGVKSDAFIKCGDLEEIESNDGAAYASEDGVLMNVSKNTIVACPIKKSGNSYTIPASVNTIAADAFCGCQFKEIEFPKNPVAVEMGAFRKMPKLETLKPGTGSDAVQISSLDNYAFSDSENLTGDLKISGLKKIGANAFAKTKLQSLTLVDPIKVTDISDNAFAETTFKLQAQPDDLEEIRKAAKKLGLSDTQLPEKASEPAKTEPSKGNEKETSAAEEKPQKRFRSKVSKGPKTNAPLPRRAKVSRPSTSNKKDDASKEKAPNPLDHKPKARPRPRVKAKDSGSSNQAKQSNS